ncbi:uncharacterized protein LOC134139763 [Rhea pennata]|uniref:uncharacterized protein LOC134139763 n=1 Tax=Rhea pennata TaxID=8795 RepID=UPI002E25820C
MAGASEAWAAPPAQGEAGPPWFCLGSGRTPAPRRSLLPQGRGSCHLIEKKEKCQPQALRGPRPRNTARLALVKTVVHKSSLRSKTVRIFKGHPESRGWNADGKGPNVWDTFTHQGGDRVFKNQTGDVACGSYTLWEEDLKCIKQLGLTHYRFSLSWSRLLPDGTTGFINQKGNCFLKIEGCSFNSRLLLQSGIINPVCYSAV